jgi:pimeloyl-ACP methyl ester carboxylesterase
MLGLGLAQMPNARALRTLFAALLAAAAAGCESLIASQAVEKHPVQGLLVEVEPGRRLQLDCRGSGSPTVVFQSGGDMLGALAWAPVLDKAASASRACAYSRAGYLWSDPARGAFRPEEVAEDLHAALKAAGEKPPYILVGHSRGGLYNMIFAGLYRDEIAGLVFVDSSHPDQEEAFEAAGLPVGAYLSPAQELALSLRWTGLLRLGRYAADPAVAETVKAFYPKSAAANAREARRRDDILEAAGRFRDLQNWPVVVLAREPPEITAARQSVDARNGYLLSADGLGEVETAPAAEAVWRKLQADLSAWSSRGRLQVVPNSNHGFFFHKPDVVLGALTEVLTASRVERRPPSLPR